MGEEFEDRDLSGSVFWGVRLNGAMFRDVDLGDATFFHTGWRNVTIDGEIDALVVNGVDVTDYVNERDRWYPLRYQLSPTDSAGIRAAWAALDTEWSQLLAKVAAADPAIVDRSVDGEWSLRDTLRHLLFAMDKWFTWPILGDRRFSAFGLPNTGSLEREWPGVDLSLTPDFTVVMNARAEQQERFSAALDDLDTASLSATVEVLENGAVPALMCYHVVLEEEFEHLRYMIRDLGRLGII